MESVRDTFADPEGQSHCSSVILRYAMGEGDPIFGTGASDDLRASVEAWLAYESGADGVEGEEDSDSPALGSAVPLSTRRRVPLALRGVCRTRPTSCSWCLAACATLVRHYFKEHDHAPSQTCCSGKCKRAPQQLIENAQKQCDEQFFVYDGVFEAIATQEADVPEFDDMWRRLAIGQVTEEELVTLCSLASEL